MINLKIKIRTTEILPFAQFVSRLVDNTSHQAECIDTVDFYNIKYFCKRLFDKHYNISHSQFMSRLVSVNININVYDSLLRLFNLNDKYLNNIENNFFLVLYRDIIMQLNRQVVNLPGSKTPLLCITPGTNQ